MGQRRRRDPLKLVCADKINRGESFCRRHWPFTVCVCARECLVVLALFRFRCCLNYKQINKRTSESHPVKDTHSCRIEVKPKSNHFNL